MNKKNLKVLDILLEIELLLLLLLDVHLTFFGLIFILK